MRFSVSYVVYYVDPRLRLSSYCDVCFQTWFLTWFPVFRRGSLRGSLVSDVVSHVVPWFQTWFFTDVDDAELQQKTGGHVINTNCSSSHRRDALCCKMAVEYDTFMDSGKK